MFNIRTKGNRAFSYEYALSVEEARVYRNLESFSLKLQNYIYQGAQIDSYCFCRSGELYGNCHRKELDSLIWLLKTL